MEKERLKSVDFARGIAIALVILGHSVQFIVDDPFENRLFNLIYSFHMSLFMFLSGFVSYNKDNNIAFVHKRAYQLLLPFFFWPLVSELLIKGEITMSYYAELLKEPDKGLWFLLLLFYISTFYTLINILTKTCNQCISSLRLSYLLIGFVLMLLAQISIYYLSCFAYGLYFFFRYSLIYFIGLMAKKYFYMIEKNLKNRWWMYLILFTIVSHFWKFQHSPTFIPYPTHFLISLAYTWLVSIIGVTMLFPISLRFVKQATDNILVYLVCQSGKKTLGLYAIHLSLVLHPMIRIVDYLNISGEINRIVIVFITTFSFSLIVQWLLSKSYLCSLLFLGKMKAKA